MDSSILTLETSSKFLVLRESIKVSNFSLLAGLVKSPSNKISFNCFKKVSFSVCNDLS